jgi:hypothetical protein
MGSTVRVPWFVKQWQAPLNRCIYTAFSYTVFLICICMYVAEVQPPGIHLEMVDYSLLSVVKKAEFSFSTVYVAGQGFILAKIKV